MRLLIASRALGPLFAVQFLGAFNDNLFKNALVLFITFQLAQPAALPVGTLITLAAALFILPFVLFSAVAGILAERVCKRRITRLAKLAEALMMLLAFAGFALGSLPLLFATLFLLGAHSAVFGPVKYGILPDLVGPHELVAANAWVEAGTFLAILLGTIAGGLLIAQPSGLMAVPLLGLGLALAGYGFARCVPPVPIHAPDLPLHGPWQATRQVLGLLGQTPGMWPLALAISWFWFVGAIFLAQLPLFTKDVLGGQAADVTFLLVLFTIGIALGSALCRWQMRRQLHARGSLAALVLLAACIAALALLCAVLSHPAHENVWLFSVLLLVLAASGGFYVVPLYSLLQRLAPAPERSRLVSACNILNALGMVISALFTLAIYAAGYGFTGLWAALAALCVLVYWALRRAGVFRLAA